MNRKLILNKMQEVTDSELNKIQGGSDSLSANFYYVDKSGRQLSPTNPARKGKKLIPAQELVLQDR